MLVRSLFVSISLALPLTAQIGGDGRDGVFAPPSSTVLDTTPNGGVFQFTRIHVAPGVTVTLTGPNPAILKSQGPVLIEGNLSADGGTSMWAFSTPGAGGPGGFRGGEGGNRLRPFYMAENGQGPGGGSGGMWRGPQGPQLELGGGGGHATRGVQATYSTGAPGGASYGSALPFDLRGGSGGGGGAQGQSWGGGGSGGGGVVVIHANDTIHISGQLTARGGEVTFWPPLNAPPGGSGAGGSIWLRSLRGVTVDAAASVLATGGNFTWNAPAMGLGGDGFVRVDSYATPPDLRGQVLPAATVLAMPNLREVSPARVGTTWSVRATSIPGDLFIFFLGFRGISVPVPPYGILYVDPSETIFLGSMQLSSSALDPLADLSLPIPPEPGLVGLLLVLQGMNALTATGTPRLTNGLVTTISN